MSHQHTWYVTAYTLLELPTLDGYADRVVLWHCRSCPHFMEMDGQLRLGVPLATPEFWSAADHYARRQKWQTPGL